VGTRDGDHRSREKGDFLTRRFIFVAVVVAVLSIPAVTSAAKPFPQTIPLPDGFQPEGIAIGRGTTFYVGSIPTGAVYRGDLRTGKGAVLVPGATGRAAIGVAVDQRDRLFVAGGPTGKAFVYAPDGGLLGSYQLASGPDTFVNDVVVTRNAAWFTDSFRDVLYRVAIAGDGTLALSANTVPLSGDYQHTADFNLNGIEATPDGRTLVVVQSSTGKVFTVDPATGATRLIDLGGAALMNGDGLLLHGRTLYVVQNSFNQIAVVLLAPDLASGTVSGYLTDPDFDVPTTIDRFGNRIYAVNARFTTTPRPSTAYDVVQVG
jgi:sugar lactone lactonase YvrE